MPPDRPHEIILATNFGLLISDDDGATWRWVCEQAVASLARLYQVGPPVPAPGRSLLFTVSVPGLAVSRDGACTWTLAQGPFSGGYVQDAFADPVDPMHVLLEGLPITDAAVVPYSLYESHDGGATFGPPRYSTPTGAILSGVEIARSDPATIYLAEDIYDASSMPHPHVVVSTDGGATWLDQDVSAALGIGTIRITAVDQDNPRKLYLRLIGGPGDALAISEDGGASFPTVHSMGAAVGMSAFLRRADGTLLVGSREGVAFRSFDGGHTFVDWTGAPHLRALAERDGLLYAAADNFADHFAVGRSTDDGATFVPLLTFDHICGLLDCPSVAATCQAPWAQLMVTFGIAASACAAPPPPDAGPIMKGSSGGCGCAVGGRGSGTEGRGGAALLGLCILCGVALGAVLRRARRPAPLDKPGRAG